MGFAASMVMILVAMILVPMFIVAMFIVIVFVMIMVFIFAMLIAVIIMIVILAVGMLVAFMILIRGRFRGLCVCASRGHGCDVNLDGFFNNWRRFGFQRVSGLFGGLAGGEGERTRGDEEDGTRHFRLQLSFDRAKYGDYLAGTL